MAKALLRRRRISSILIYIHDMASNLINWGPVTGPHDFLPPFLAPMTLLALMPARRAILLLATALLPPPCPDQSPPPGLQLVGELQKLPEFASTTRLE
jgi:hypothetical protein